MKLQCRSRTARVSVSMGARLRAAIAVACASLCMVPTASAGEWNWGYNFIGPGTDNGVCYNGWWHGICSGFNYWTWESMNKNSGGNVCWGYARTDGGSCQLVNGTNIAGQNVGGYWQVWCDYYNGATSYLHLHATT